MALKLVRQANRPEGFDGQLGKLYHDDEFICVTLERLWIPYEVSKGGKPNASCVPDGFYKLVDWDSPRWGKCKALENPQLDVFAKREDRKHDWQRWGCLFVHAGNKPQNFLGCVGAGAEYLERGAFKGITDTRRTCDLVNKFIRDEDSIEIVTEV